jgi:hypothetical protein
MKTGHLSIGQSEPGFKRFVKKEIIKNLLLAWRDRSIPAAEALLEQLFESADQVLLEYADKAENNAMQAKFFEGQRELWLKKEQLETLFHDHLLRDVFQFMRPARHVAEPGAEVLSLVSKDNFELSLALETISDQAIKRNQELYYGLSQRLGVVSGGPAVPYEELPAGPHQLAGVFERAAGVLNVERQVLLALYTLLEREVIRKSPLWHGELNEALREKGILPNLKYELKIQPSPTRPDGGQSKENTNPFGQPPHFGDNHTNSIDAPRYSDDVGNGFSSAAVPVQSGFGGSRISGAAATAHGYDDARRGATNGLPEYHGYHGSGGSRTEEQGQIGGAESGTNAQTGNGGNDLGDQLLGRIRELLTARRARHTGKGGAAVRPDPVTPAIPPEVVAIIDSPQVQQAMAPPETGVLEAGVRRVVISRALLQKLRDVLAAQREQIKATVGDDKLSHFDEDTFDIVGMLFEAMLNDARLSNTVKALFSHLHTPYLKLGVRDRAFLTRREHPARRLFDNLVEAGSRWVDESDLTLGIYPGLQRVVDSILKARDHSPQLLRELDEGLSAEIRLRSERQQTREVRTLETEKGKARLEEARKEAGRAMQEFLAAAGLPARYQAFMNGPWTDYLTLLYLRSNGDTDTVHWRSALDLGKRLRTFVDGLARGVIPSDSDLGALRDELGRRLGDAIPHYETQAKQLFDLFSADYEIEIVAPATPVASPKPPAKVKLAAGGEALLERLPQLPSGRWIVFHSKDEPDQVVKLSWFNRKTERFLFVDQAGTKALVVPLRELADQIDRQRAHILPDTGTSYIESTLEHALNNLEQRA